jgi:hypothetical protein
MIEKPQFKKPLVLLHLRIFSFVIIMVSGVLSLSGQDIETLISGKPLRVTGYLSAGSQYITDNRFNDDQFNPFGLFTSAGITFNLYDVVSIPFTATWSNNQFQMNRRQFRLFGLSPSYRWITLHGGYRSYNISPYLLTGRYIMGGGVDLNPGKFRFSVFYGNMVSELNYLFATADPGRQEIDMYKRRTVGGKIGFGTINNFFELHLIRAVDQADTGNKELLDSLFIMPVANFGLGLNSGIQITRFWKLGAHIAGSAINYDLSENELEIDETGTLIDNINVHSLMPVNETVRFSFAYDLFTEFNINRTMLRLKYQHIDPDYAALGVQFLQTNVRNYLLDVNTTFLESKFSLFSSLGLQYTNSKDIFAGSERRVIFSSSASYTPNSNWNFNGNYSNFNSSGNISVVEFLDSLRLINTSENYSMSVGHNFGDQEISNNIGVSGSLSRFSLIQGLRTTSESESGSVSFNYSRSYRNTGWTFGGNLQYQQSGGMNMSDITRYGMGLMTRKRFGRQFSVGLSPSYNFNYTDSQADGNVINVRSNASWIIDNHHSLSMGFSFVNRNTTQLVGFNQTRFSIQYNARF